MSQSTPIDQIRRNASIDSQPPQMDFGNMQQSESQLVEDILCEMGNSPGMEQQTNINSQAYQYATDSSQVPQYKYMEPEQNIQTSYSDKMIQQQSGNTNNGFLGQMGINLNSGNIKDKIINNIKYPALVFVISFIISLPEFNRFLFGFFPKLLLESGQVSVGGVILKAIVGMIVFALIALFL
jgi:hypothetical protein